MHRMHLIGSNACVVALLSSKVTSFSTNEAFVKRIPRTKRESIQGDRHLTFVCSKNKDDDEEENDIQDIGMKSAFDQFDQLKPEDFEKSGNSESASILAKQLEKIKALETLDEDETEEELTDEEVKLYTDMFSEINDGEGKVYGEIMGNLQPEYDTLTEVKTDEKVFMVEEIFEDADGIGNKMIPDRDEFVEKAVAEALEEAQNIKAPAGIDAESFSATVLDQKSIREDEQLMLEINAVFDRARDQLQESFEEIRQESLEEAKIQQEKRDARIKEEQARLDQAEESLQSLIGNVSKESRQVQQAMKELEEARASVQSDPLLQLADFRSLNIVKQGTVAGTLLFTARALTELVQGFADPSHLSAALVQFAIAFTCAILFIVL